MQSHDDQKLSQDEAKEAICVNIEQINACILKSALPLLQAGISMKK